MYKETVPTSFKRSWAKWVIVRSTWNDCSRNTIRDLHPSSGASYSSCVTAPPYITARPAVKRWSLVSVAFRGHWPRARTDYAGPPAGPPCRSRSNRRPPDARAIDRRWAGVSVGVPGPNGRGDVRVMSVVTSFFLPSTDPLVFSSVIATRPDHFGQAYNISPVCLSVRLRTNCDLSCLQTEYWDVYAYIMSPFVMWLLIKDA